MIGIDFHFTANCVAAFSFVTSAIFLILFQIPATPVWSKLRRCKVYLSLTFLIVALACGKTVVFGLGTNPHIIQTSTLITACFQSLLFACTGVTFLRPDHIRRSWLFVNLTIILLNATQLICALIFWDNLFRISAALACVVYLSLWASYQVLFYRLYRQCIHHTDELTDENSEYNYRWIKYFFMAVSLLGITACIAPFMPVVVYDCWTLAAALFYIFVLISFVNYWNRSASLVLNLYAHAQMAYPASPEPHEEQDERGMEMDYTQLEERLEQWIRNKGFTRNDQVSEELAQSLGVNIATFRSYFRNTGKTDFRQWRMKLRINYACQIMREHPEYSYDTVAQMTGIGDRSNFLKMFKKVTGKSPKEFFTQGDTLLSF